MAKRFEVEEFGVLADGSPVKMFTVGDGGIVARFSDYGARLLGVMTADGTEVVLGYETLAEYAADRTYSGAVVGRFGNRIAGGKFTLDGKSYQVPQNNGENALHGGPVGFDQKVWAAEATGDGVEFTLVSPAGDQGFPGMLTVTVRYAVSEDSLRVDYSATTDATTVVNLTNHAYFNLAGTSSQTILDHEIMLTAERYTPTDAALIPTGELAVVEGTPFDFKTATRIGARIEDENVQLERAGGYDHNFVMGSEGEMKLAAKLTDPGSRRWMTVETTEPGIQFYSGNFMDAARTCGKYARRGGLCLETQHYPDSPNHADFPSTVVRVGETLRSTTVFRFGLE
jgi:aldose 1-epimerase